MMGFRVGDHVCAHNLSEGIIIEIDDDFATVECQTDNADRYCLEYRLDQLEHVANKIAMLRAFKTPHKTVNVMIQNCTPGVITLLQAFDIWMSGGRYEWDINEPKERPKIWFECPAEFLDFIETDMGKAAFKRFGVQEFYIEH